MQADREPTHSRVSGQSRGRTVSDQRPHVSAQLCDSFVVTRAAVEIREPIVKTQVRGQHRDLHQCTHRRWSAFFGWGGFSLRVE